MAKEINAHEAGQRKAGGEGQEGQGLVCVITALGTCELLWKHRREKHRRLRADFSSLRPDKWVLAGREWCCWRGHGIYGDRGLTGKAGVWLPGLELRGRFSGLTLVGWGGSRGREAEKSPGL